MADGFLRIAVANMANAIKQVSVQKGHDASRFALQCFGGAGGQHACQVADALGMETVFIHPYAGVLSAYGMGLADQTAMREQAVEIPLEPHAMGELEDLADKLATEAEAALLAQGADPARVFTARQLHLRYAGTEAALIIPLREHAARRGGLHRRPPRPLRLRHAGARAGGGGRGGGSGFARRSDRRSRSPRPYRRRTPRRSTPCGSSPTAPNTPRRCSNAPRSRPATASPARR